MEFRKLTTDDLNSALEMNRTFREGFLQREAAETFLNNPDNWLFAAVQNGEILGFAYGYALQRLDRPQKQLYIHEVGVQDNVQRQGIGFRMMQALLRQCAEENICKCFLTTYQNNAAANALYRKLGGQVPAESQGNDAVYYFPIP